MTAAAPSPLARAIRAGCEIGTACDYPECGTGCPSRAVITLALRSLATPTPEAVEAVATALVEDDPVVVGMLTKTEIAETARAGLTAYWAHILGETGHGR